MNGLYTALQLAHVWEARPGGAPQQDAAIRPCNSRRLAEACPVQRPRAGARLRGVVTRGASRQRRASHRPARCLSRRYH